jgi:hypothetical protein
MKSIKKVHQRNQQTQTYDDNYYKTLQAIKAEKRARELEILNRNLMKKIYADLLTRNIGLYQEKNLTFENFLFFFYKDYESLLDFDNPDYKLLLNRMDLVVKMKFDWINRLNYEKNKLELNKDFNYLAQGDEWALIDDYKNALYKDEQAILKKLKEQKYKKYIKDLDRQIWEKKNYIDPIAKKKEEIYLFKEKEEEKKLEELKILNQEKIFTISQNIINYKILFIDFLNKLENENYYLNKSNKDLICYKINFLNDIINERYLIDKNMINIIENIINENDLDKIKKKIQNIKYRNELINQMNENIKNAEREYQMSSEERKMNKDWLEAAKTYFNQNYNLY